ncbi:putative sugar transferase EpsL [Limihaloglobus sulfuriphilus]|uniref:Putative sugar transferase EpsL n=1 Tax=Limihaloglobus sulfuriphilus TaxID=1851148 RepID=A0A1Q2MFG0_9BACT|nr:sugar transferase [Limihaloglobus sulfuriphilus]AQQ71288.1 putative sugar transferase EpsL [Limihaloglobus sulfuriphilus]
MYSILKRVLDILISLGAILLLLPVYLTVAVYIKCVSPGAAVFRQERAGRNAKPFILYKFRTMRLDCDPYGNSPDSASDSRLIKGGDFLRRSSLDELPQLFNVLKGQMSMVGPRPLYVSQIPEWGEKYISRLDVKPGMTGLAQVMGRGALTIEEKLELDVEYVRRACIWLDIKIMLMTLYVVLTGKDIYEKRYSRDKQKRGEG